MCVCVAGLDHILDADTSSGEADTENSTDESDSDEISITDITCDFGEGLKLEHAFTMCTHVPRLRVYSASELPSSLHALGTADWTLEQHTLWPQSRHLQQDGFVLSDVRAGAGSPDSEISSWNG